MIAPKLSGPILLTGAGGDIGIALARVLREALPEVAIHGADCDAQVVGAEFVDAFHPLPRADAPQYVEALRALTTDVGAAVLIPLAETELARLLGEGLIGARLESAALITANAHALATGLDKLATARLLGAAGIAVPESGIVGEDEPGDYDLIVKPRSGQGSKGLIQLAQGDYAAVAPLRAGDVWQRWLKDAGEEYTCGIARFPGMPTRSIAFRRSLRGGLTGRGEVVHDPRLAEVCTAVAEALDLTGAINIQLRIDAGLPHVFEINPRFSSTVGFRHRLGFCDALWAIRHAAGLPVGDYAPPPAGTRIERVALEVIRPPARA